MTTEGQVTSARERRSFRSSLMSGLAFGLGFSIVFVTLLWASLFVFAEAWHRDAQTQFKEFGPSSGLVIESQEPIQTESNLSVLGVLRNDGANAWQFIRFQISLRGAQGGIVGICEDSAMAPVYPGQKRTFQLNCRGIPEYKTYTLEIVNASYVRGGT